MLAQVSTVPIIRGAGFRKQTYVVLMLCEIATIGAPFDLVSGKESGVDLIRGFLGWKLP
jgi:hypothetical protein